MKNKIYISIFSALLLISVSFVTPIHVKADEMESRKLFKEMKTYSEELSNDDDFQELANLHCNEEIVQIFQDLLNAETNEDIQKLANEYIEIIDIEEVNEIGLRLDEKLGDSFDSIIQKANNLYDSLSGDEDDIEDYYYVVEDDLKISKYRTEISKEDKLIIRGCDGSMKIGDGTWISQSDIDDIMEFLLQLQFAGIAIFYFGYAIGMIGLLLSLAGFEVIGHFIFTFGMKGAIFGIAISAGAVVAAMIVDIIVNLKVKSKTTQNSENNIAKIFNQVYLKILLLMQKIFSKTCITR